jgi:hypothetical protein
VLRGYGDALRPHHEVPDFRVSSLTDRVCWWWTAYADAADTF